MANLLLSVMGAFAEFERALINERQREGISWPNSGAPIGGAKRPSPPRLSPSCARALRWASARPKWPGSLGSARSPPDASTAPVTPERYPRLATCPPSWRVGRANWGMSGGDGRIRWSRGARSRRRYA